VGVLSASTSIIGLFLYGANVLPLPLYFFIDSFVAPSLVTILVVGIFAHRINEPEFLKPARHGLLGRNGRHAVRVPIRFSGLTTFNPFFTNQLFGQVIIGYPASSFIATAIG